MICFVSFERKVVSFKGRFRWEGVFSRRAGFSSLSYSQLLFKKPHKTYIADVRCDAGRAFDYTSYFLTVGLSNTAQLRLLGNYPGMLELLDTLLCCLWFGSSSSYISSLSVPHVIKTCYSTSVCQALRNQTYAKTRCLPIESNCCAAQAFNCNKRDDFSIVARFRGLISVTMST